MYSRFSLSPQALQIFTLWLYSQNYLLNRVSASPTLVRLQVPPPANTTSVSLLNRTDTALSRNIYRGDWPPFPWLHYILHPTHPLEDPQWMYFISEGTPFDTTETTALGWQIGSLEMRLADLKDDDPCPPFFVNTDHLHTMLRITKYPPTVQLCRRAIATVDKDMDKWGAKEIQVYIGEGDPRLRKSTRGILELGIGMHPPANE